ncbi:MAG: hypothetical protein V4706_01795 [Pseudomonadota bacterium]
MKPAPNAIQQLLDLVGITGKYITRVTIECNAVDPLPTATVTSYLFPLVVDNDELQTTTAKFNLVPLEDGLQAEPEPLDIQALADDAMARMHAYIAERVRFHSAALSEGALLSQKKRWVRQLISDLKHEMGDPPKSPFAGAVGGMLSKETPKFGPVGMPWFTSLFDGWVTPVQP